jgi:hypothetical protein
MLRRRAYIDAKAQRAQRFAKGCKGTEKNETPLYSAFSLFFAFLCFFAPLRQQFFVLRNMSGEAGQWMSELICTVSLSHAPTLQLFRFRLVQRIKCCLWIREIEIRNLTVVGISSRENTSQIGQ